MRLWSLRVPAVAGDLRETAANADLVDAPRLVSGQELRAEAVRSAAPTGPAAALSAAAADILQRAEPKLASAPDGPVIMSRSWGGFSARRYEAEADENEDAEVDGARVWADVESREDETEDDDDRGSWLQDVLAWSRRVGARASEWVESGGSRAEPKFGASAIAMPDLGGVAHADPGPLALVLKREERVGVVIIGGFLAIFGFWALLAPLSSAAIAPGVVSPDSSRKTIQHLEGGIVKSILVRDGAKVEKGDLLAILDGTLAQSSFQALEAQHLSLVGRQARLQALQRGTPGLVLPAWLARRAEAPEVSEILALETRRLGTERQAHEERKAMLRRRIAQLNEEINGLRAQVEGLDRQLALVRREVGTVELLLEKGLETVPRQLALRRTEAEMMADRGANLAAIARSEQAISETELELTSLDTRLQDDANKDLSEVQMEIATVAERLAASQDVLKRVEIRAPVPGTVVALKIHTPGGVVGPGDPLMDIVPKDDLLIVDVQVRPQDIDVVHEGLRAQVHLSAFNQRNLPRVEGTVVSVSADRLTDQRTGQHYFKAQVVVDPDELARLGEDHKLTPGMPADVMIVTGELTLFDYLYKPFVDVIRRSFREG